MCSKIVSNTLIYVTLQQFCTVTDTSGNSGQGIFQTAWGNFGHETKIASIMFLYYLWYVIVDYYFKNQIIV